MIQPDACRAMLAFSSFFLRAAFIKTRKMPQQSYFERLMEKSCIFQNSPLIFHVGSSVDKFEINQD